MPYTSIAGAEERLTGRFLDFGGEHYDLEHPAWGMVWDNVTDDGPAINSALDWIGTRGGGVVTLPEGTGRIRTGIEMKHYYLRLKGRGGRTVFNYDPVASGTAIKMAAASGPIGYCHVHDMRIITPANSLSKWFLEMVDISQCAVYDMYCTEGNWDSPGGGFLKTKGREFIRVGPNITFAGEQFWKMEPNPNYALIGCDHAIMLGPQWLIGRGPTQNALLTNRACIEKMPGCPITSFNSVGVISVNRFSQIYKHKSTDGVTSDTSYSANLNFIGWRREQVPSQMAGAELYSFEFDGSAAYIRGLVLDNLHLGAHPSVGGGAKGIKLLGVTQGSMRNVFYDGLLAALEIAEVCDDISWTEFFSNGLGSHLNVSGDLLERFSDRTYANNSGGMPNRGHYVLRAPAVGLTVEERQPPPRYGGGVFSAKLKVSIAAGGSHYLPVNTAGTRKVMEIRFIGKGVTTAAFYRGAWIERSTVDTAGVYQGIGPFVGACSTGNVANNLTLFMDNNFRSHLWNQTSETIEGVIDFDLIA